MTQTIKVGNKIRKIRELKSLSQEHLADKLDMTVSGYSRIERDEVSVSLDKLSVISETLGVSIEELLSFDEKTVFNNFGNAHDDSFTYRSDSEKLVEAYKSQIDFLKEEIKYLKSLINQEKKSG
ncbi:helix-turn-helix domain-containing protein [Salibacter halophilus]|uniref:Helix-turn-helix transcriptional regulator n=1 Tax=Salibacter halophilus TaxID=1803916 RepID=A0A6N6M6Y4_9FLAO|nr:helix-turn-helix transcriptional regulator [Salibacter halophilus]KAB1064071.1 helix-turn-helix transcriptional regulator [Salibacter halophilus]